MEVSILEGCWAVPRVRAAQPLDTVTTALRLPDPRPQHRTEFTKP
jgi:hypothetical protein